MMKNPVAELMKKYESTIDRLLQVEFKNAIRQVSSEVLSYGTEKQRDLFLSILQESIDNFKSRL